MSSEPKVSKVTPRLVATIVDDIAAAGWPVGELLGSEPALIERYGVSRETFRAAVGDPRIPRRRPPREGRGGGLVPVRRSRRRLRRPLRSTCATWASPSTSSPGADGTELSLIEHAIANLDDKGIDLSRGVLHR